jgi:hypothetical protein
MAPVTHICNLGQRCTFKNPIELHFLPVTKSIITALFTGIFVLLTYRNLNGLLFFLYSRKGVIFVGD